MGALKPGGRVGVGFWIEQSDIDWIAEKLMKYLPEYFESVGEDYSAYSKENSEGNRIILRNGGFSNIRIHEETTGFVLPDAETWRHIVLPFYAVGMLLCGLASGIVAGMAIIRHGERSWLAWLAILPGLMVLALLLGEILAPQ